MPNIQYDSNSDSAPARGRLPHLSLPSFRAGYIVKALGIVALLVILNLASAVVAGVIAAFSANIDVSGVSVVFDPLITIAYILVYYALAGFYRLSRRQTYFYLLFTLLLSFTISFLQGTLVMVVAPPLLQKLRLIEPSEPAKTA